MGLAAVNNRRGTIREERAGSVVDIRRRPVGRGHARDLAPSREVGRRSPRAGGDRAGEGSGEEDRRLGVVGVE